MPPDKSANLPYISEIRVNQRPITEGTSNVTFAEIGRARPMNPYPTHLLWVLHAFGCDA